MWPLLLDMTKDESVQTLRNLELEAYSHLVSALRAQGPLDADKKKLLKETSSVLNISEERHKAEVRRALSDEKLNTIAYHVAGQNDYAEDWAQEGRRIIPLMPRMAPQTAFSTMADEVAENVEQINKQLPLPANTERKRPSMIQSMQNVVGENNKANSFRMPDTPKHEENRKRRFSESSSLAQHLLGPPKVSKIQQIYRQKTKLKTKEQFGKMKSEINQQDIIQHKVQHPIVLPKPQQIQKMSGNPKINILQNVNLQQSMLEDQHDQDNYIVQKFNEQNHITSQPVESINSRLKIISKSNNNIMIKPLSTSTSTNLQNSLKMYPSRKTVTKTVPATGQKLIVVSNAQTMPSSSILQRTLTIPFVKNISVKNFDKFKIVSTSSTPVSLTNTTSINNFNSNKHKVVTVQTNTPTALGKKVFPLTQLQMLSKGNIKVVPIGGKILTKTPTTTTTPAYFANNTGSNVQTFTKNIANLPVINATKLTPQQLDTEEIDDVSEKCETIEEVTNNESEYVPVEEDYDTKIDEFHIQTVPVNPQEEVVEVQCEDNKDEEIDNNIEADKGDMICLPEIDCFISEDVEVVEPSSVKDAIIMDETSIQTEEMEVEIIDYSNDSSILNSSEIKEDTLSDLKYVEN